MFKSPVVFVDIETTGGSYLHSRVLEVAAVRFENGQMVDEFSVLLNPETYVPSEITRLTGIKAEDVVGAPIFSDIAERLYEFMDGAIFIAHNVRFDYMFLKSEYGRLGMDFSPKLLCTVRLSRALYPDQKGHSLAALIDRHNIPVLDRHRALEDARAIAYFSQLAYDQVGNELFQAAVEKQLKTQYLPSNLDKTALDGIQDVPGVYIFKDELQQPIYIGKSVTLKKRIMSHFHDSSAKELKIAQRVHYIETIPTGSELAALLLESKLIKEKMPIYNRLLRRVSAYVILQKRTDEQGYDTVHLTTGQLTKESDLSMVYGVYESRGKAKQRLEEITRSFQLCPKLMGLEKAKGACFSYSLGRCKGACVGEESADLYNRRFELALMHNKIENWPYPSAVEVPVNEAGETVIINNWIVEAFRNEQGEVVRDVIEPSFDLDEYKITKRFLRENKGMII